MHLTGESNGGGFPDVKCLLWQEAESTGAGIGSNKEGKSLMSEALSWWQAEQNMENGAMWGGRSWQESMAAVTAVNLGITVVIGRMLGAYFKN